MRPVSPAHVPIGASLSAGVETNGTWTALSRSGSECFGYGASANALTFHGQELASATYVVAISYQRSQ